MTEWRIVLFLLISLIASGGCSNKQMRNFNSIPSFTRNNVNVVIEIPAGTTKRIKYYEEHRMFLPHNPEGAEEVIDFLPSPGNYGFVPGTFLDPVMGGDGDPVKVLVLSENVPTGTVIEAIPLLVLYFEHALERGKSVTVPKIIAVPAVRKQQVINASDYTGLFEDYPDIVEILVRWFSNYGGYYSTELKAIGNEEVAVEEIKKWELRRY
jgi:inorganic pyrophosphatase